MVNIILVGDVDLTSASRLVEWVLNNPERQFDLLCAVGLYDDSNDNTYDDEDADLYTDKPLLRRSASLLLNDEERAIREGEMTAIITQLENIVCRVIYIPSAGGNAATPRKSSSRTTVPLTTARREAGATSKAEGSKCSRKVTGQVHEREREEKRQNCQLTANSKDINGRTLRLCTGLRAVGISEPLSALANDSGNVVTELGLTNKELEVLHDRMNQDFLKTLEESVELAAEQDYLRTLKESVELVEESATRATTAYASTTAPVTAELDYDDDNEPCNSYSEYNCQELLLLCSAIMDDIRKPGSAHEQSWLHGFWDMEPCQQHCLLHLTAGAWLGAGLDRLHGSGSEDGYGVVGNVTIVNVPSLKKTGKFVCVELEPIAANNALGGRRWTVKYVGFERLPQGSLDGYDSP